MQKMALLEVTNTTISQHSIVDVHKQGDSSTHSKLSANTRTKASNAGFLEILQIFETVETANTTVGKGALQCVCVQIAHTHTHTHNTHTHTHTQVIPLKPLAQLSHRLKEPREILMLFL
jgi:hypothetical protein